MQQIELQFNMNMDYRMKEAFKTLRSNVEFCGSDVKIEIGRAHV